MAANLTFMKHFPVTAEKPMRVDTISFVEANRQEIVDFFEDIVDKFRKEIAIVRLNNKYDNEGKIADLKKEIISLKEEHKIEMIEKKAVINYLENNNNPYCDRY